LSQQLLRAAHAGNAQECTRLLQCNADVCYQHEQHGGSALFFAAQRGGAPETVAVLIRANAFLNSRTDMERCTALIAASRRGCADTVALLLAANCNLDLTTNWLKAVGGSENALSAAVRYEHHDVCMLLLDAKAYISSTAFEQAAALGSEITCRAFIDAKANVNQHAGNGGPLLAGAKANRAPVCALLLEARAKMDVRSLDGDTCLLVAAARGHCSIVKLLLQSRANPSLRNSGSGGTALHAAALHDRRQACALLLQAAEPQLLDNKDKAGRTALQVVADEERSTTAQLLRDWRGADAFAAEFRKSWLTMPSVAATSCSQQQQQQQQQYCWTQSRLFDVHLIDEITRFLL
jgi:serine/threonine-protein phosphatase 6 regulatory ankyrin repeat subunit B